MWLLPCRNMSLKVRLHLFRQLIPMEHQMVMEHRSIVTENRLIPTKLQLIVTENQLAMEHRLRSPMKNRTAIEASLTCID